MAKKQVSKKAKRYTALGVVLAAIVGLLIWFIFTHNFPIFEPGGQLGREERSLIYLALILAVIVVVPTFFLAIMIAIKYNEKNATEKTKYRPDFDHSKLYESIWWGIPIVIIGILSVVAWNSAHQLDPMKPLMSDKKPLTIEVVSLDWKWLFVYPEQNVASVNEAAIPVNTPVNFQVTSDTIMNSFWVPGLGGQIYSMPGMITQLHEMADRTGNFDGSPANIAGEGFSHMFFTIKSMDQAGFNGWISHAATSNRPLDEASYAKLSKPSYSVPVSYYSSVPNGFIKSVAMKYMGPMSENQINSMSASQKSQPNQSRNAPVARQPQSSPAKAMPNMEMN